MKVRGLYDYVAKTEREITFKRGDVISVLDQQDKSWWYGMLDGESGYFPKNYVEIIVEEHNKVKVSDVNRRSLLTVSRFKIVKTSIIV